MISLKELEVLKALLKNNNGFDLVKRVSESVKFSLFENEEDITGVLSELEAKEYITQGVVSELALEEMEQYRVNNAIILAAGGASSSSKSFYSLPKGLYVKNGETLIERQIRQLKDAGINDITVVLGYREELFFFLAEKYGVKLANTPAIEKGNVITLNEVKDKLSKTYICSSDNYYVDNPFSKYEYNAFHAVVSKDDCIHEVQLRISDGRIIDCFTAKGQGTCFYGHAFCDEAFSKNLIKCLDEDLDIFRVDMMFWEELVMRHISEFDWNARKYSTDFLFEFDTISETQSIETLFINDVRDKMISRICNVLNCNPEDVSHVEILNKGMTNIVLTFVVENQKYLFRYPGESSWQLTDKHKEVLAQNVATKLGLDKSCFYIDKDGCKISRYREDLQDLSEAWWNDASVVCKCAKMMRQLHDNTSLVNADAMRFDSIAEGDRLMKLAGARKGNLLEIFGELREKAVAIKEKYSKDDWKEVLCHHDWKYDNILCNDECFDIIDWEYGSIDDPGADLIRLLMGRDFDSDIFNSILDAYFMHETTEAEKMHVIAAFVPICYYWLGWLMYQESLGNNGYYWTVSYFQTALAAIDYTWDYYLRK